ncbi:hypothetical protein F6B41_02810 [Microbacterium lushaniae]|nr:hypothetical protein F6B41_28475 [Microbacterium lushaniae]KAA9158836.1 hypothetical protein F6B41_02810 [Microbacterium lushaniae]
MDDDLQAEFRKVIGTPPEKSIGEIAVFCTDAGQHNPSALHTIVAYPTRIGYRPGRAKRASWGRDSHTEDGASVANSAVMPVDSPRDDFEDRERFRFPCKRCGRDPIIPAEHLRKMIEHGIKSLDISEWEKATR